MTLKQPLALPLLTLLSVGISLAAGSFLYFGHYARKETVRGYLAPERGLIELHAPRQGVFSRVFVSEGQTVDAGDVLVSVSASRTGVDGADVDAAVLREIEIQAEELGRRLERERARDRTESRRLAARIAGLETELAKLRELEGIQREVLALAQRHDHALAALAFAEIIPKPRLWERRQISLGHRLGLEELAHQIVRAENALADARISLEQLPSVHAGRLSELRTRASELLERRIEIEARRAYAIRAPARGRVATLQATPGAAVVASAPVASLLPAAERLRAELLIPSRAIGFVRAGQLVHLRYDAFPYQRFGSQRGRIAGVTGATLSRPELRAPFAVEEAMYRATVRLSAQEIAAFGTTHALRAGMLLEADIILDRRSLLDWLLEPLARMRKI